MKKFIINILSKLFKCYRTKTGSTNLAKTFTHTVKMPQQLGSKQHMDMLFIKNDKENKHNLSNTMAEDIAEWGIKNLLKLTPFGLPGAELVTILLKQPDAYTIKNVLDKLNQIEDELKDLVRKVTVFQYEDAINARNNYVQEMENAQKLYTSQLINADSDEEYKKILDEWATKTIGGNPSLTQFNNFINAIMNNLNDGKTLYDVYDAYTYYSSPWENMGYRFREEVRAVDLAIILSQVRLAILYYVYTDTLKQAVKEEMIKNIQDSLQKFLDYYNAHKVVRHEDVAICQIPGAQLTIQKNMVTRPYYNMSWFPNGTEWHDEQEDPSTWLLLWGADCRDNCHRTFSETEFDIITKYYAGQNMTFNDILRQGGMNVPNGRTKLILCSDAWTRHDCDCDYYIDVQNVCSSSEGCSIGKDTIGSAYLERYGFLWLKQKFTRWARYDYNNVWIIPKINR